MSIQYPNYPCVAMEVPNMRQSTYDESGKVIHDQFGPEIVFYKVTGVDDLTHVDFCRKYKRYAVVGYAHLEKIAERAPFKAKEVAQMKHELDGYVNPPELRRAERVGAVEEYVKPGRKKAGSSGGLREASEGAPGTDKPAD